MISKNYILALVAIVLVGLQVILPTNNNLGVLQGNTKVLASATQELVTHIEKSGVTEIAKSVANEYFHILIIDTRGETVYWNTRSHSKNEFLSGEHQYSTLKINGLQTYLIAKNRNKVKSNVVRQSISHWVSALLFLVLIIIIFFKVYYTSIFLKYNHEPFIKLAVFTVLTGVAYLILPYIKLPSILQYPLLHLDVNSIGIINAEDLWRPTSGTGLDLMKVVLIATGFTFIAKTCLNMMKRKIVTTHSILSVAMSYIVTSALFLLFVYVIKHSVSSPHISSSLDTPLQYTFNGIALLSSYVILALIVFYLSLVLHRALVSTTTSKNKYIGLLAGTLVTIPLAVGMNLQIPMLALYAFILAYFLILDIYIDQKAQSAVFLFLWLIIFSGFIASVTFFYQLQKDVNERMLFARSLYFTENSELTKDVIKLDNRIKTTNIFNQLSTLPYPAKLDHEDFSAFLYKELQQSTEDFEIQIECFESTGSTLFKNHYAHISEVNSALNDASRLSEHIYYNPLKSSYILDYYIENESFKTSPLKLTLELTKPREAPEYQTSRPYDYFIIDDEHLVVSNSSMSSIEAFRKLNPLEEVGICEGHNYIQYSPAPNIKVVTIKKQEGLLKPISLFSFLITLAGVFFFILSLINTKYGLLPAEISTSLAFKSSLKNKIQFTIITLTIFSFIIIGLMTIIYFKNVLNQRSANDREAHVISIVNNIQSTIAGAVDAESMRTIISSQLDKISHIHNKNLSLYHPSGPLVGTSLSGISNYRLPFNIMKNISSSSTLGTRSWNSKSNIKTSQFIPLVSNSGLYAVLEIPDSKQYLNSNSLLDFLSTILNVYIFLFLVAGAIAIAISNSITKPLSYLSEKLKLFKLGKNQEPIKWTSKDEIGSLISNYNNLVSKLDESAHIIAKTERDTAWREMAKQVAHEIKNPLTPMKLSIQHLQRISKSPDVDVKQMVGRISTTLLEQFNNLDNIANSFANFASMPTAQNQKTILNEVVESIHDLFRKRDDMDISLSEPINDLYVYADRNHLVRVLNNIVKNAIQAIPTDRKGIISISLDQVGNNALIKISDNGIGIPDHMKDKVFAPNFTTKNSGTGLGLAISANMIESFNGKIFFKTENGKGTDFYIEIPLMRLDQNFEDQHRVSLD